MTREEAIELLDDLIGLVEDSQGRDYDRALHMAIEALEREKKFEKSFEGNYIAVSAYNYGLQRGYDNGHRDASQEFAELLKKLKERKEL